MIKQNQIKRTLVLPESITIVRGILGRIERASRAALVDAVCLDFGFLDSRGATQNAGCAKALRELERAGHFVLSVALDRDAARPGKRRTPRRSWHPRGSAAGCARTGR